MGYLLPGHAVILAFNKTWNQHTFMRKFSFFPLLVSFHLVFISMNNQIKVADLENDWPF